MRAYFFGNMYLSSIQQGIQAQHCTAEMFITYLNPPKPGHTRDMLFDWARNHKTTILLDGGDCEALVNIHHLLNTSDNPYPWAAFHESWGALDDALTCVGIILPERVYWGAAELRKNQNQIIWDLNYVSPLSDWEKELAIIMNSCGMAR